MKDNIRLGGDYKVEPRNPIKEDKHWLGILYFLALSGAVAWAWILVKGVLKLVELKIID